MPKALPILGLLAGLVAALPASAANRPDPSDPIWPCVQRKVPELSLGAIWAGPEIDPALATGWDDDREIAELVRTLMQRRIDLPAADAMVAEFATTSGPKKRERLLMLFSGLFDRMNLERKDVMGGIDRFARKQIEFSETIKAANQELADMQKNKAEFSLIQAKNDEVLWDVRVFDERQKSLTYVCEVPVLIEQRLFHLAKTIEAKLAE